MLTKEAFDTARKRLWDELVHLHVGWEQYEELYSHSAEMVRMLNACARWFFASIQRALLREAVLGISRLTDPAKSGKFVNLTLGTLLLDPDLRGKSEVRGKLEEAVRAHLEAARSVRAHRNKYIAHLDHATATGEAEGPLPSLSKEQIASVIDLMETAYNVHNRGLQDAQALFDLKPLGGADALVDSFPLRALAEVSSNSAARAAAVRARARVGVGIRSSGIVRTRLSSAK